MIHKREFDVPGFESLYEDGTLVSSQRVTEKRLFYIANNRLHAWYLRHRFKTNDVITKKQLSGAYKVNIDLSKTVRRESADG